MKTKILLIIILIFSTYGFSKAQSKIMPYQKGDIRLDIKLPHINYLAFKPDNKFRDAEIGFNGYGIGFEYNYKENKFLETNLSFVLTFELPFPAVVDAEYNKILTSSYISITDNLIVKRFTFGYGLSYAANSWKEWTRDFDQIDLPTTSSKVYTNTNLGLCINTYYRIGKTLHLGIIYQPGLINLNASPQLIYEHSISMEVNWRIRLNKTAKRNEKKYL